MKRFGFKTSFMRVVTAAACALMLGTAMSCAPGGGSTESSFPFNTPTRYFQIVPEIAVDVYYEPGAEPFFGTTPGGKAYWHITRDNLVDIFKHRSSPPTVTVPTQLTEMTAIAAQGKTNWLGTEILALDAAVRTRSSDNTTSRFSIYFLNGYFNDGNGSNTAVIGVSLSGTPIIAIFKGVVTASGGPVVQKFVEQSTIVHEMGHALGFVNNGVPMVTNHQDTAHGRHTTDTQCVMYYLNEGTTDLIQFFQRFMASSSVVMWGTAVQADAQSFSR